MGPSDYEAGLVIGDGPTPLEPPIEPITLEPAPSIVKTPTEPEATVLAPTVADLGPGTGRLVWPTEAWINIAIGVAVGIVLDRLFLR
jgi:hypothetical protein